MPTLTIRDLPLDVHQAIKVRARAHGRSTEAEVRAILGDATRPANRQGLGSALAAIADQFGPVELESPFTAEPMRVADYS